MIDLKHYRCFVTVAQELHFGRAARRLHIAQPALSIQIRKLEDALGGTLFRRTQRSVELTEAGRQLLPEALDLLERAELIEQRTLRAMKGEVGHLAVGYSSLPALTGLLGSVVGRIRGKLPDLTVSVKERDPVGQIEEIVGGQLHFGLTTSLGVTLPEELTLSRLADWRLEVVVPKSHPVAGYKSVMLSELKANAFIVYRNSSLDDGCHVLREIGGFVPISVQEVTSPMMVIPLVAAGFGVSLLPSPLTRQLGDADVVRVPIGDDAAVMDCSLLYRKSNPDPMVHAALNAALQGARQWSKG